MRKNGDVVVTGMVRLCYPNLFRKKACFEGDEEKYSLQLLISKGDVDTLGRLYKKIDEAMEKGDKLWGKGDRNFLKTPLRDGTVEREGEEVYFENYFLNAFSSRKPEVVGVNLEFLEEEEIYSGCYGKVSLRFFPYNKNGHRGVGCMLCNVQKIQDGEEISFETSANEDFNSFEEDILA